MAYLSKEESARLRLNAATIRRLALEMVFRATSGHIGGSFSLCELLSVLYFKEINVDPADPSAPERDRFVLSKGHCTPALYPTLALKGFFPVRDLSQFRDINFDMSGHAEMKHVKGVDMSTGSLGQGISAAVGMALAGKMDNKNYRVYAVLGDGESQEGQVWEAAMFSGNHGLDNLTVIVDNNKVQLDGHTADINDIDPLDKKFEAFKFNVIKCNGHDVDDICRAFEEAKACKGKPSVIIADTVKGKGVSFMENTHKWHGNDPDEEQYNRAKAELDKAIADIKAELDGING